MSTVSEGGHEVARGLGDIERDLERERQVLDESIRHDYSSSETGIVPLSRRRPIDVGRDQRRRLLLEFQPPGQLRRGRRLARPL